MPSRTSSKSSKATKPAKPAKPKAAKPAKPKAAKLATSTPSLVERTATYVPPADACGLARVPDGIAANERAAMLLGLGYPRMLVTIDEPVPALPDYAAYKRRYLGTNVVPRELVPIMYAIARSVPSTEALDRAVTAPRKPPALGKAVQDAMRFGGAWIVEIIEALHGSEPTAQAIVDTLAAASVKQLNGGTYENYGYSMVYRLGSLLWRIPAAVRAKHRETLAIVLDKLRAAGELWRTGQALDVILNGRAGVERSGRGFGGKLFLGELMWADDDPAWIATTLRSLLSTLKPADREVFNIQLAVAGGPDVLAMLRDVRAKFRKDEWSSIDAQLSLCAPA